MNLYRTRPIQISNLDFCLFKIRACVCIVMALFENDYRFSISRAQFIFTEVLMLPNVVEERFVQEAKFIKPI